MGIWILSVLADSINVCGWGGYAGGLPEVTRCHTTQQILLTWTRLNLEVRVTERKSHYYNRHTTHTNPNLNPPQRFSNDQIHYHTRFASQGFAL